ncbi:MAG: polysaccharide biosynthesis tyrosine autokinase [Lentisphaerae bacterium]|nr:polysaccharide biosynthesis tyrosine autokinase [Lentisphaerota bacterium]
MAVPGEQEVKKIDLRVYVGMLFFRWQIIVVCFLYALLGGLVYVQVAPRQYQAHCQIMVYRDPQLTIPGEQGGWSLHAHAMLMQSDQLRGRVAEQLEGEWGRIMGGRLAMMLPVTARGARALFPGLDVSVTTPVPGYGAAFLARLIEEHEKEWKSIQNQSARSATEMLENELVRLEEKIDQAENDLIEYQRLHDIARVEARGDTEEAYLTALMGRRNQIATETMMLDAQYEAAQKEDAVVINEINRLTRETGAVGAIVRRPADKEQKDAERPAPNPGLPEEPLANKDIERIVEEGSGWQDMRVRYTQLVDREKEMAQNLLPEHPRLQAVRAEIQDIERQLAVGKEIELRRMRDRKKALEVQLEAIEAAEYKWQAKDLLAAKRQAEMSRIAGVVDRFEKNYDTLYSRLHTMRVSEELKSEQFGIIQPATVDSKPLWPDPVKILLVALTLGLGSGFGLAIGLQFLDNKVQTIKDVEQEIGVPFLGGVPYWVHSGLETSIRPIVTEEHSSGAVEAYRALRTMLIAALEKANEKIVLITSADSREGKTLTALNLAIVMAQMNKKVLLLDLDLRRGRLHRSLGVDREPGIADALREGRSLKEIIVPARVENLHLGPTGSSVEDSAELLQSADLVSMFVDIQDDYDYILCDTSPVLRVTDTVILATHGLGVVVYVARVNHTPKPLIRYSLDMLEEARVLGLIMNSIEMHKISSLYYAYQYPNYAYYSNAYAYGYDYYNLQDGTPAEKHRARQAAWRARWREASRWLRNTFMPSE